MRNYHIQSKFLFCTMLLSLFTTSVHALEVTTHEKINSKIAESNINGFQLDSYLKNTLGLTGGKDEIFNKYSVKAWLSLGGRYEDEPPMTVPYLRSVNHFHNPLTR